MKDFKTLRERLKKVHGIELSRYFWVKEFTRKGQRHLHILCSSYVDWKILKNLWKQITQGESYQVWINEKRIKNPAGYLFKYLGKAYGFEKRFTRKERRYGFSRNPGFSPVHDLPILGDFWEIIVKPIDTYGFTLLSEQEGMALIDELYPEESICCPVTT